ncbi:MAG: HAD-IA family hydrolase [Prevotella sp.]|nr:HAD-IA family hydrolase [Prevotella sp.]
MKEYDTYIFDLDGTLLDTLGDLSASVNYALRLHGMAEHSVDDVRQFVGNGVRLLMTRAIPDGENNPAFEDTFETFRTHYLEHSLDTTLPYPGIMEMLGELHKRGKRLAVVSNKLHTATKDLCRHFFAGFIEAAIGENEAAGVRKKPAPDTVVEALRQLGVGCEGAVYVGDSEVDIATARNASLPCISVLWGFRDRDFLLSHGATTFAEQPSDLL